MSDDKQNKTKSARSFDAYAVRNDKDGNGHFHKIGAAFQHKDGEGYDIDLVAAPTNGRVTLRAPKDRLDQARNSDSTGQSKARSQERGHE